MSIMPQIIGHLISQIISLLRLILLHHQMLTAIPALHVIFQLDQLLMPQVVVVGKEKIQMDLVRTKPPHTERVLVM